MTDDRDGRREGRAGHVTSRWSLASSRSRTTFPGITQPLKLTGPLVADIFLGKVTKWNDRRIAALNPGVKLPATDILVVHRIRGKWNDFHFD